MPPGTAPTRQARADADRDGVASPRLAFAVLAMALLATVGFAGLFEPTETRYAEIAREMRASGQWLIPHLNGIAHLHKAPFVYWAVAACQSAFGDAAWASRLPVALATMLTFAFTWMAARGRFAPLGISPGLTLWMLGTMALPFAFGRTIATDPFLAMTVAGFWALAPSTAGIALVGLGFFIKGPVVFVPTLLPVLVAAAWARSRAPLGVLGSGRAWLLAAAIALPWYLIVSIRVPGLLSYLIQNQLWARYATQVHHRGGPPWYFIAVVVAGSLPWTAAAVGGLVRVLAASGAPASGAPARDEARLLVCWLVAPLVFFSFSGSKLPAYVLPCAPGVAMLAALGLERASRAVKWATVAIVAALIAALVVLGPRALSQLPQAVPGEHPGWIWWSIPLWALAAFMTLAGRPARAGLCVLLGWLAIVAHAGRYDAPLGSPRRIAELLAEQRGRGEPVVEYHRFNAGIPLALRETVRLLDVERELFFTPGARLTSVVITRDSLVPLVARHGRVWMFAPAGDTRRLADSLGLAYQRTSAWNQQDLGFIEEAGPRR